jgi:ABC-type sugar transport system ATPase subunit
MKHVSKTFGHVVALRSVDMCAYAGEILALVGDNGAGKSTIVKILAGVYQPDEGEIEVRGAVVRRMSPRRAGLSGISTVYQDLGLIDTLDVATNMFLGQPLIRFGIFANRAAMYRKAATTLRDLQVRVPSVRIPVAELSGGQRQSVAIARSILVDHPIVLMDEPTAALGVRETRQVGRIIDSLRELGKAVVVVSHNLEFVLEHADRVQAMRLGSVRGVRRRIDFDREEIVGLITGLIVGDEPGRPGGDHAEIGS